MTNQIGIRELKNQASKIVRTVREESVEYIITVHGEPVAVLRPLTPEDIIKTKDAELAQELADLRELGKEISAAWVSDKSGVELVEEQ
ncbi:MAG: type II toxin-antitoxin system prevent-host-death family antitoxin, partial [Chloroflexi bacterium]|nr:type II toxin-antitoxin system prevent-host-death family antitoxin [Chloroflexota bacterium]